MVLKLSDLDRTVFITFRGQHLYKIYQVNSDMQIFLNLLN